MKCNLDKLKLKWKIFAFLLGFCLLLLTILWLFQTVFLDSFYRRIKVIQTKSCADSLASNLTSENLSDLIANISRDYNVSIEIMDENGIPVYSEDVLKDSVIRKMTVLDKQELILGARKANGEFYEYRTAAPPAPPEHSNEFRGNLPPADQQAMQSLIYVELAEDTAGRSTAIFVESVISPLNATVQTLRYQLYFITIILLALAILLALIIAKQVSKPIEDINRSAKGLAKGDYEAQFQGKGFLEVNELSDTLNTAAAELRKVDSLRRDLLANISHDLRTPLSLIYSYAEVMHDFPDEITGEQTQVIMDETQRLSSLVNDVLDISRLESGVQQLDKRGFNLTRCLEKTTRRVAELVKKDGYRLTFDYDGEVTVSADEVQITQVYYNLLINAIHYTGEDKTVAARQVTGEGTVRIEVKDTGNGIAAEDLPYIWDRYYKVDKKHKRALTGTGLGLSIVKRIMELHGGQYGVESQVNDTGSTFWFSLEYMGQHPKISKTGKTI